MKRWLLIGFLSVAFASPALAGDFKLEWQGHENATGYRVYISVDFVKTWSQLGPEIPQPDPFPADGFMQHTLTDLPEDQTMHFRVSAVYGGWEDMIRHHGLWYDFRLKHPGVTKLSGSDMPEGE